MKCEHGNEIEAIVTPLSYPYWDDGIEVVDANGNETSLILEKDVFLKVTCPICNVIRIKI